MRRPDHHNEIELNFLETGSITYLLGGRKTVLEAGRLCVFWAAIPHQIIEHGPNTSYFVATIPLPWFLQWRLPESLVQNLLQGHLIADEGESHEPSDGLLFANWERDFSKDPTGLQKVVLLEMHARLLRLALRTRLPQPAPAPEKRKRRTTVTDDGLSKVERMAAYIALHYTENLSVQDIARTVALHPNYAMNLFRKSFGTTLVDYLTQHRISHSQRLLATSQLKVADIAFESGFCSISRFNDAFRRACGCTPRDYRRAHAIEELAAGAKPFAALVRPDSPHFARTCA